MFRRPVRGAGPTRRRRHVDAVAARPAAQHGEDAAPEVLAEVAVDERVDAAVG